MANNKTPRVRKVRIRGKTWRIVVERPPGKEKVEGLCVYDERTIYLRPGTDLPATLIHEVLHACYPDLNELSIMEGEDALLNAIAAMKLAVKDDSDS
jgi:hypothetical protein